MENWNIDVPVLLIFWARPEPLKQTFEAIRKARPSTLLLWQDGPRGEKDMENIRACREIVENIDWDCRVYRKYNEQNYGCDPSTFFSHKWAFSIVDKCIVLEDDVVASTSFFQFCKEMLDKYENDMRINKICGMNQVKNFVCPDSYFFSSAATVWGWATWKRVADSWDQEYTFLDDEYSMRLVEALKGGKSYKDYLKVCQGHRASGKAHWETIQTYSRHLNSQMNILPAKNLVHNVGLGENSTHSNTQLQCLPKKIREVFYCEAEELVFPLKHPKYVVENIAYKKQLFKLTGRGNPWVLFWRRVEGFCLRIRYMGFKKTISKVFKR